MKKEEKKTLSEVIEDNTFNVQITMPIEDLIVLNGVLFEAVELYPTDERQSSLYSINSVVQEVNKSSKLSNMMNTIALKMEDDKFKLLPQEIQKELKNERSYRN